MRDNNKATKRGIIAVIVCTIGLWLGGCGTVRGLGQDLQAWGEGNSTPQADN